MWNSSWEFLWELQHIFFMWPFSSLGVNKPSQIHIRQKDTFILASCIQSERIKVSRLEDPWVMEVVSPNPSISKAAGVCKNHSRNFIFKTHFHSWLVLQSPADEVISLCMSHACLRRCPANPCETCDLAAVSLVTRRRQIWERKVF